jgi:hypothetical protein
MARPDGGGIQPQFHRSGVSDGRHSEPSGPEQGKLRRALAAVFAWIDAMDYSSGDYALDRIKRLEREVGQLKEELRQSRDTVPVEVHDGSAAGLEH